MVTHLWASTGSAFNLDVVGGTVGSLCAAYESVTQFNEVGHRVNLLFDHDTDVIKVDSPYTHENLCIRLKQSGPLFVRIPSWVNTKELSRLRERTKCRVLTTDMPSFLKPPVNRPIEIRFPTDRNVR